MKSPNKKADMTNEQYRKMRGTHKPFKTTPEQAKMAWCTLMAAEIAAGAKNRATKKRMLDAWRESALRGAAAAAGEED